MRPGAEQAGEADDLAAVHLDVGRLDRALAPERRRARARIIGALGSPLVTLGVDRLEAREVLADHLGDELGAVEFARSGTRRRSRPLRSTVMRSLIA